MRIWTTWLLLAALIITTPLTPRPAYAAGELTVNPVVQLYNDQFWSAIEDGGTLPKKTTRVEFFFNGSITLPAPPDWITVTDSKGNRMENWGIRWLSGQSSSIEFSIPENAPELDERYTFRLKGGPNGIHDTEGRTLPQDLTFTFHTASTWGVTGLYTGTPWNSVEITANEPIEPNLEGFSYHLTEVIDPATLPGNVILTNSRGEDLGWQVVNAGSLYRGEGQPLEPNETYTVRFKGGPGGLVSFDYRPLPADVTLTFKTVERPLTAIQMLSDNEFGTNYYLSTSVTREVDRFKVFFDRRLDCRSIEGNVSVTDAAGNPVDWPLTCTDVAKGALVWAIPSFLPDARTRIVGRNEAYTFHLKGGPDGLRSLNGQTMTADASFTLTTKDEAARVWYRQPSPHPTATLDQAEAYFGRADAGLLIVEAKPLATSEGYWLTISDAQSGEQLFREWVDGKNRWGTYLQLPKASIYRIHFSNSRLAYLTIGGPDLELSLQMPGVQLGALKTYETRNQPFTLSAGLTVPGSAGLAVGHLDGEVLLKQALRPDGTLMPITVDPSGLAEGLHTVQLGVVGSDLANAAWASRTFLVDRVDTFADVPAGHWARRYVEVMAHLEILSGGGNGLFAPGRPVTRAAFAKMLAATLGLAPKQTTAKPFADMKEDWSKPYLQAVFEYGLMGGDIQNGQRYFYPEKTMSRAEAAVTLARLLGVETDATPSKPAAFKDWATVPTWARASVVALVERKWLSGFPDGTFGPAAALNRDQAAKVLSNLFGME
ncbi:MAG TPA: S-layer homology domain-containing protein [Symbiobacteriaceae bacterium]|nr:S-layer homology domain-containing protein [Symbiobacteriaceae bacterium]